MENPYFNGDYVLTFSTLSGTLEKKVFRDIANGYPLEAVQLIRIFNDRMVTELVFGDRIIRKSDGKQNAQ